MRLRGLMRSRLQRRLQPPSLTAILRCLGPPNGLRVHGVPGEPLVINGLLQNGGQFGQDALSVRCCPGSSEYPPCQAPSGVRCSRPARWIRRTGPRSRCVPRPWPFDEATPWHPPGCRRNGPGHPVCQRPCIAFLCRNVWFFPFTRKGRAWASFRRNGSRFRGLNKGGLAYLAATDLEAILTLVSTSLSLPTPPQVPRPAHATPPTNRNDAARTRLEELRQRHPKRL